MEVNQNAKEIVAKIKERDEQTHTHLRRLNIANEAVIQSFNEIKVIIEESAQYLPPGQYQKLYEAVELYRDRATSLIEAEVEVGTDWIESNHLYVTLVECLPDELF